MSVISRSKAVDIVSNVTEEVSAASCISLNQLWLHAETDRLLDYVEKLILSNQGITAHKILSFVTFSGLLGLIDNADMRKRVQMLDSRVHQTTDFTVAEGAAPGLNQLAATLRQAVEVIESLNVLERGRAPWEYVNTEGTVVPCPWCQKEFNIPVTYRKGDSHGICPRHRVQLARDAVTPLQADN